MSTPSLLTGKWLYRALLKEAKHLPDTQATQVDHYLHRIKTDFRKPLPLDRSRAYERTSQAQKLLRRLIACNSGHLHAIERVLDQAYARKGKQSHQLLEPFLTTSRRSKTFVSPSLRALILSPLSHQSRPPNIHHLENPPTLPARAFPDTEESRLLGPLIPQRIKAIRRRYWNSQTAKIKSPLAVLVLQGEGEDRIGREEVLKKVGLGSLGEHLQSLGMARFERLEDLTQVREEERPRRSRRLRGVLNQGRRTGVEAHALEGSTSPTPTVKKEVSASQPQGSKKKRITTTTTTTIPGLSLAKWSTPKVLRPRLMRRRYEAVLENAPIVIVERVGSGSKGNQVGRGEGKGGKKETKHPSEKSSASKASGNNVRIQIRLSDFAKSGKGGIGVMGEEDRWWNERGAAE
ncbi:BQ2448_3598 [Microbotryum intermedium]|uniref:BQ2448_3598 protein n=1 Tax=Microbotryum intermedium TaxID=269621 RepID=A0A238FID2_9BASI|nr:BQ2448_3598 [Microbotryum intermedium]